MNESLLAENNKIILELTDKPDTFAIKSGDSNELMIEDGLLTVKLDSYTLEWRRGAYTEPSTHITIGEAIEQMENHLGGKMHYELTLENILPKINQFNQRLKDNVEDYGFCPRIEGYGCPKNVGPCEIRELLNTGQKIIEDEDNPEVYDREARNDCWYALLAQP